MKIIIIIIIFIYSISLKANDITEFQIEGISLGDSALDYFSEEDLNNA